MNIKKDKIIIDQVNDAVQNWSKYAKETGVAGKLEKSIRQTLLKV